MIKKVLLNQYLWLGLIIILSFIVRLYKIDNPIADWHSWRQADTASVARNFYKDGFTPFTPKYDDMSGVAENPIPNPGRFRFVEFPIYNSIVYFGYLLNGGVDERIARLVSILFSLGSIIFLFLIVKKAFGMFTAMLSALFFAILPYNIYFSRVILPEPILVFLSVAMFYFVDRWIWEDKKWLWWTSLGITATAFLTKPQVIFYLLPLIYSYYRKEGKLWPIPRRYIIWFILAVIPFGLWRVRIMQHPEGIPASNWLLNGTGIRFRPAFWRWIISERLGKEILAVTGTFLFFIGLIKKPDQGQNYLLHLLALSLFLFVIIFATGNVQHDYYQAFIVPALVIFLARGAVLLLKGSNTNIARFWTIPLAILFMVLTPYFSWQEVKGLYQVNNPSIVEAGQEADKILPKDALVVAPYQGDTAFLYQTNRHGWAIVAFPIKDLIDTYNVHYYISVNYDDKTNWVLRKYTSIEKSPKYTIVDLTKENPMFDRLNDIEPM